MESNLFSYINCLTVEKRVKFSYFAKVSSINSSEQQQQREDEQTHTPDKALSSGQKEDGDALVPTGLERPGLEDNLFLLSKQNQDLSTSFSQSAEIFQELQQECMRRLNVPIGNTAQSSSPSQTSASCPQTPHNPHTLDRQQHNVTSCNEDKPQIPPRVPIPPRPIKRGDYTSARWSRDLSLSPTPADTTDGVSCPDQGRPPQIPPRDPLSQPGSRTPSPMCLGSPQQRVYSVSPTSVQVPLTSCPSTHTYSSYLSTSPGKLMPTTHSFASDPKYAAPRVIQAQAQGKDSASKGPCILPIVRDGRKVSNTHYYLLPERPPYLDRYDRFFREAESLPASGVEERHVRQVNTATVRPMVVSSQSVQGHAQGQPGELKANFSTNNNSSLEGPRSGMKTSVSLPWVCSDGLKSLLTPSCTRTDGADKVKMVRSETF